METTISKKSHHAARPRGALIATRTGGQTLRRHRVACPRGAMIRSGALPSDHHPTGINPRRDGDRVALVCWLRLPSDGDKPQRNEELRSVAGCDCHPMGTSPTRNEDPPVADKQPGESALNFATFATLPTRASTLFLFAQSIHPS